MTDKLDESMDNILTSVKEDSAILKESVFKQHLLPMLVDVSKEADLSRWLEVAGSWRRDISVVSDTDDAQVLFTIPALVGDNDVPLKHRAENSAYELIRNSQRRMAVVPVAGEEMLKRGLKDRVHPAGDLTDSQVAWNFIYTRYGYEELVIKGVDIPETTTTVVGQNKGTISGYDEA